MFYLDNGRFYARLSCSVAKRAEVYEVHIRELSNRAGYPRSGAEVSALHQVGTVLWLWLSSAG